MIDVSDGIYRAREFIRQATDDFLIRARDDAELDEDWLLFDLIVEELNRRARVLH